jgi:hypothetical protein
VICPACHAALTAAQVLEGGSVAIPEAAIVVFRCPACRGEGWARIRDGALALGASVRDPARFAPGPDEAVPALSFRPDATWLDCWHEGRYRRYPARAEGAR